MNEVVWKKCQHPRTPQNTTGVSAKQPRGQCKTCARANGRRHMAKYREANRERRRALNAARYAANREQILANGTKYRAANHERVTEKSWRHQGILNRAGNPFLWSDYIELRDMQNGACLTCGRVPGPGEMRLVPDHHHASGICRALICASTCNLALGVLEKAGITTADALLNWAARASVLFVVPAVVEQFNNQPIANAMAKSA